MRKIDKALKLIYSIFIIVFIITLFSGETYAICNTVRFSKEVSAVQLRLADGSILHDMKVSKNIESQVNILPATYKNLNVVFVVETQNGVESNKLSITQFVKKVYQLYGSNANKIKMGIVPFKDVEPESEPIEISEEEKNSLIKNTEQEILNAITNLDKENNQTLQKALMITQENLEGNLYGNKNDQLLQCVILITDGISHEEVCVASNVILKDLSENMVTMYGMLVGTSKTNNLEKLVKNVSEMTIAENVSLVNVGTQLVSSVYDYISKYVIRESTLIPVGGGGNTLFTSDSLILFADEELIHGAELRIEYTMSLSRYALYGSGEIYEGKILDLKSSNLRFSQDAQLLSDPSKTNADYGWQETSEGLVTMKAGGEVKLLLSATISPQGLGEGVYSNSAKCATSFDVGGGETARYSLMDTALDVKILPPFGNSEKEYNNDAKYITIVIIIAILVIIAIIAEANNKRRKKRNL